MDWNAIFECCYPFSICRIYLKNLFICLIGLDQRELIIFLLAYANLNLGDLFWVQWYVKVLPINYYDFGYVNFPFHPNYHDSYSQYINLVQILQILDQNHSNFLPPPSNCKFHTIFHSNNKTDISIYKSYDNILEISISRIYILDIACILYHVRITWTFCLFMIGLMCHDIVSRLMVDEIRICMTCSMSFYS